MNKTDHRTTSGTTNDKRKTNFSIRMVGLTAKERYEISTRIVKIVTTFTISIVVLVLFWVILFASRNFNITVSDSVAIFLSIVPFVIYLVVFEKISEVSGGGWQIKFKEAAEKEVSLAFKPVEFVAYRIESKGFAEDLRVIRANMRTRPTAVLSLTVGNKYDATVLTQYLKALTRFDDFKYVVFIDVSSRFIGSVYARTLLDISEPLPYEEPLPRENRWGEILKSIETGKVYTVPSFSSTVVMNTEKNIDALEKLDQESRSEIPVVNQDLELLGFTSREVILSSIVKSLLTKA
jgi:hypothetical protein